MEISKKLARKAENVKDVIPRTSRVKSSSPKEEADSTAAPNPRHILKIPE